jgi:two-component sensor histidine kinase/PAS domain-containing protein
MQATIRVLIALSEDEDQANVQASLTGAGMAYAKASDLGSVEKMLGDTDVILTDTGFAGGAFVDWLSMWPVPAVLLVDPQIDPAKLAEYIADESSAFLPKDKDGAWVRLAPTLIRKCTAVRESIDRQNTHSIHTESSYMNLMRIIPDIVYVLDGDGCFVYLNDAVSQLGWKPGELLGKHFAEVVHPDDLPEVDRSIVLRRFEGIQTGPAGAPKLFDERRSGERMTKGLEVRLRHRDGTEWTKASVDAWGEVSSLGVKLPEFQGRGPGTVGIIHNISERHEAELKMARELEVRELMLKEMHHRVKNNLQVVSSLLSLESNCVEDERAKKVFVDCQTQVHSMSLVHEQIYRGTSLKGVEAAGYFARLAEYLSDVHDASMRGIGLLVRADERILSLDVAMPLSIIATELVSNSFKHAFPERRGGTITISLEEADGTQVFSVSDDGIGFGASKAIRGDDERPGGIGMDLVDALASQLGAKLERIDLDGASTVLRFPVQTP